jgi:hypothetical protein
LRWECTCCAVTGIQGWSSMGEDDMYNCLYFVSLSSGNGAQDITVPPHQATRRPSVGWPRGGGGGPFRKIDVIQTCCTCPKSNSNSLTNQLGIHLILEKQEKLASNNLANQLVKNRNFDITRLPTCIYARPDHGCHRVSL